MFKSGMIRLGGIEIFTPSKSFDYRVALEVTNDRKSYFRQFGVGATLEEALADAANTHITRGFPIAGNPADVANFVVEMETRMRNKHSSNGFTRHVKNGRYITLLTRK